MEKEIRNIFGTNIKATPKQLDEIYKVNNYEKYWEPSFQKYFTVFVIDGCGVHYFIKEKYFHSDNDGETNYAVALLKRFAGIPDLKNRIYHRGVGLYY